MTKPLTIRRLLDWTETSRLEFCRQYSAPLVTITALAEHYGVSRTAIRCWAVEFYDAGYPIKLRDNVYTPPRPKVYAERSRPNYICVNNSPFDKAAKAAKEILGDRITVSWHKGDAICTLDERTTPLPRVLDEAMRVNRVQYMKLVNPAPKPSELELIEGGRA